MVRILLGKIMVSEGPQDFGQIIHNKTIPLGKHLSPDDVHLPAWDVEMKPVQKRGVMVGLGKIIKQVGMFEHIGKGVLGVAHKDHGGLGTQGLDAPGKGLVGHVVFHDIHQGLVGPFLLARKFIKGHHIPVTHQPQFPGGIINKEFGNGHLAPGHQYPVGREF